MIKIKLTCFCILFISCSFGQIRQYAYKRELFDINEKWHKIVIPDEIFGKLLPDLSDLRIFGLKDNNDTIEAPYILQVATEKIIRKDVNLNLINQSKNNKGYYFTFEIPSETVVNQIDLDFLQQNFDWRLSLEGSHNQQEWFTIVDDYRILSIKNELMDFQFTKLNFPSSKYRYFRLFVDSKRKPDLIKASMSHYEIIEGQFEKCSINTLKIKDEKQNKKTLINVDLKLTVPVSYVKIYINDKFDYYRHITIEYLSDSIKTQQGWKYNYKTLTTGTLNSIEKSEFGFSSTIMKKLRFSIENQDNEPLHIDSLVVKGCVHSLIVRFVEPASYFLTYGNLKAVKPQYDIDCFKDKIPSVLKPLKLGNEQIIEKDTVFKSAQLFKNKNWLWAVMILIIASLGWFSLSMIRKK